MTSKDEDADIAPFLEMTEAELRAHIAARGIGRDATAAELTELHEDAPVEQLEKTLFGASLDDIMTLSEFADLQIKPVGFVRQNQKAISAPLSPSRSRRDHTTPITHVDATLARQAEIADRTSKRSD
jgi:hypothetical protein